MFEALQDGLSSALKTLRGHGKLSESNMRDGLKLVAADLQRPAAIDQLHVLGEQLEIPVFSDRANHAQLGWRRPTNDLRRLVPPYVNNPGEVDATVVGEKLD